ncbi:MAG: Asp-tRNA(Asn)/Glu-tRNA(Gln) amidotransferase subunit GatC [Parcubacteria group bacterium]|nr:Asp-tRNA(Asn)/Glu-tRNA(Gln) amidotransferase subunit GatC [Parcubacteria group bacterium]
MISKEEVEHIAKLARLELTESELKKMQNDLAGILDYVDVLQKADISKVKTTEHSVGLNMENVTREDEPKPATAETIKKIKEQFPDKQDGHLKVKGILN